MNPHPPASWRVSPSLLSRAAGITSALIGGLTLIGWWLDVEPLQSVVTGLPRMGPCEAVGLAASGIALWLLQAGSTTRYRFLAAVAAAVPVLVGASALTGSPVAPDPFHPAVRPALTTALAFVLVGTALWTLDFRPRLGPNPAQFSALLATLIALLALLGYAAGVRGFYGAFASSPGMAPHSAVATTLLGPGILCARPDRGLAAILVDRGAGGLVGRRLILVPVLLPLVTGLLRQEGQRRGLYNPDVGGWLFSMANIAIFILGIWYVAGVLRRTDAARARAEGELRSAAGRFQDLYDLAPCGYHSVGPDGVVVAMNRTELGWLGYSPEEVTGRMRFGDVVSPASREAYLAGFARVREHGSITDLELELVRKDGTTFPVLVNSTSVRDPGGGYLMSRTTLTDLTERKRAEAATRLFGQVTEHIPAGLIVCQMDGSALRVRSANPFASEVLGMPPDRAIGREIAEVFPAVPAGHVRRYAEVARLGRGDDLGEFQSGDHRITDRWWQVQAFPLPDDCVGVACLDVSGRKRAEDLSRRLGDELEARVLERTAELAAANEALRREVEERARAEAALRLSEQRYRSFVEASAQVVWITGPGGELDGHSAEWQAYTGQTAAEARGFGWTAAVRPEDRERVAAAWRRAVATRTPYEVDYLLRVRDGTWRQILARGVPVVEPDGRVREWVGTCIDVTAAKTAEAALRQRSEELAEANRDLEQKHAENEMFVYSVSHDLRSPLVNLQGFSKELEKACRGLSEMLADEAVPPAVREQGRGLLDGKVAKSVGFIRSAVMRLSGIIDALLRLSRAGRVEYRWEAVDVAGLVSRVIAAAQGTIAERGAEVRTGELFPAWGDRTAVEQVFGNLIGNALTYLDPARRGVIEVGCLPPGTDGVPAGFRVYFVRDNGLGIPDAHRAKIFHAFQRAHPGVGSGEGLGLAIVARVAERHRGRAWVDSAPGAGSTFYVTLPVQPHGR